MRHRLVYMYKACGHIRDLCTHSRTNCHKKNRKKYINIDFYGGFNFFYFQFKKKIQIEINIETEKQTANRI